MLLVMITLVILSQLMVLMLLSERGQKMYLLHQTELHIYFITMEMVGMQVLKLLLQMLKRVITLVIQFLYLEIMLSLVQEVEIVLKAQHIYSIELEQTPGMQALKLLLQIPKKMISLALLFP
jgi:hypothetical protein